MFRRACGQSRRGGFQPLIATFHSLSVCINSSAGFLPDRRLYYFCHRCFFAILTPCFFFSLSLALTSIFPPRPGRTASRARELWTPTTSPCRPRCVPDPNPNPNPNRTQSQPYPQSKMKRQPNPNRSVLIPPPVTNVVPPQPQLHPQPPFQRPTSPSPSFYPSPKVALNPFPLPFPVSFPIPIPIPVQARLNAPHYPTLIPNHTSNPIPHPNLIPDSIPASIPTPTPVPV